MTDPREYDGNPYEVAARAVSQAEAVARILASTIDSARIMARNAEMERELHRGEDPNAPAFDDSAQGRRFEAAAASATAIQKELRVLGQAAGYNPKTPLDG